MNTSVLLFFRGYPIKKPQGKTSKLVSLKKSYLETDFIEVFIDDMKIEHLNHLSEKIKDYETVILMAESMGCLSAMYLKLLLNNKYIRLIVLNPSYYPEETLKKALSTDEMNRTLQIKEKIEKRLAPYLDIHFDKYKIRGGSEKNNERSLDMYVFQCQDDDRVDCNRFNERWKEQICHVTQLETGGHIMSTFPAIEEQLQYICFGQYIEMEDFPEIIDTSINVGSYFRMTIIDKNEIKLLMKD